MNVWEKKLELCMDFVFNLAQIMASSPGFQLFGIMVR